jgi:hypothetical protein
LTRSLLSFSLTPSGSKERAAQDLERFVLPYLANWGIEKCYLLGFCWGGILAVHVATYLGVHAIDMLSYLVTTSDSQFPILYKKNMASLVSEVQLIDFVRGFFF